MMPTDTPPLVTCESDAECELYAQFLADEVERPRPQHSFELNQARCISGCAQPTACICLYTIAEQDFLDRVNVQVLDGSTDCHLHGGAPYCLLPAAEFQGCEPDDVTSCDETCLELLALIEVDQAGYEVEVRRAQCTEGACQWNWRVNDRCFAASSDSSNDGQEFSCDLSDDEVLASSFPPGDAGAADRSASEDEPSTGAARDAGAGVQGTPRSAAGPEEANWSTMVEGGRTWATAEVCGYEFEPVCVAGDCADADLDAGAMP